MNRSNASKEVSTLGGKMDEASILKKFKPSSGVPNYLQRAKRVMYLADGGQVDGISPSGFTSPAPSDAVGTQPVSFQGAGDDRPINLKPLNLKKGGLVKRGCGIAQRGRTKGRIA